MADAPYTKLFQHKDRQIDDEFINAYRRITKVGEGTIGPQGPVGPKGDDGALGNVSAILTLRKICLENDTLTWLVGTLPPYHIIHDITGIVLASFNVDEFRLGIGQTPATESYYFDATSGGAGYPRRIWPYQAVYTDPIFWMGLIDPNERNIYFKPTTPDVNGDGVFWVCINYLLCPELENLV